MSGTGRPAAVARLFAPPLDLLKGIDAQKTIVTANVARLAAGHAAHDMLLWGSRGMGKSALLRASGVAAQAADPPASRWCRSRPMRWPLAGAVRPAAASQTAGSWCSSTTLASRKAIRRRPARAAIVAGRRRRGASRQCPAGGDIEPPRHRATPPVRTGRPDQPARRGGRPAGAGRSLRPVGGLPQLQPGRLPGDHRPATAAAHGLEWERGEALEWSKRRGARSGRVAWQFVTELAGRAGKLI
jgi:hypothetical protein